MSEFSTPTEVTVDGRTYAMCVPYLWDADVARSTAIEGLKEVAIAGARVLAAQGVVERAEGEARGSQDPMAVARLLDAQRSREQAVSTYLRRKSDLKCTFALEA